MTKLGQAVLMHMDLNAPVVVILMDKRKLAQKPLFMQMFFPQTFQELNTHGTSRNRTVDF